MKTNVEEIFFSMNNPTENEKDLIKKAYNFAEAAHNGQFRKSGDPYFTHVFATAMNLAELKMDSHMIAAGFLHDTLEDTNTKEEDLVREFGEDITSMVKGVTKLGNVKYKGIERNVENLRKFFISVAEDLRVLVIKLADRLHNVETLEYVRPDKQKRIALETLEVYAPLADRLSMGLFKGRLEDAAFQYAYPKEHKEVYELLKEKSEVKVKYLMEVHDTLVKELEEAEIENSVVNYRHKHLYSLWRKLQKYDMDINKIYDIIALRVIVNTVSECYHVLGIIHGQWTPVPNRIKDYIAMPKSNGYQSLHTTIFTGTGGIVEIQIRTQQMHKNAENGLAAHFVYKDKEIKKISSKKFAWINEIQELNQEINKPAKLVEAIKMNFFKDRVFAFTPKGDIIDLPEEASVIDFAYAIHTDLGNHAQGARINGKNASLQTKLKTNDIVEIQVNKNAKPSSKWLDCAKTSLARKQINNYLKENSLLSKFLSFSKN